MPHALVEGSFGVANVMCLTTCCPRSSAQDIAQGVAPCGWGVSAQWLLGVDGLRWGPGEGHGGVWHGAKRETGVCIGGVSSPNEAPHKLVEGSSFRVGGCSLHCILRGGWSSAIPGGV